MSKNRNRKDVLFLGLHRPNRSPSQRYRIEQFLPVLKEKGILSEYDYLLTAKMDKQFYAKGALFSKAIIVVKSFIKLCDIAFFKATKYHYVFVQREAFMLGTSFFERIISQRSKLIFDFDDSIWMANVSKANAKLAFLKNLGKTKEIIQLAHVNVVGNSFLAEYALKFSKNVKIIPTCIDTNEYKRRVTFSKKENDKVCIGWSGSQTTIEHFKLAEPFLYMIKEKYGDKVYFKVIGDESYQNDILGITGIRWQRSTEIHELEEFDIGIMPLPNDEWSKGKCGLKGLVYMSMEMPSVLEAVGVNQEIVQDGENGLLCDSHDTWVEKLSLLIENKELRQKLGQAGRQTILDKYSIIANQERFISLFKDEE